MHNKQLSCVANSKFWDFSALGSCEAATYSILQSI